LKFINYLLRRYFNYFQHLPQFGPYREKLHEMKQNHYKKADLQSQVEDNNRPLNVISSDKVIKLKDVIGRALDKIGQYNSLNNKEHVVALIDEVSYNRQSSIRMFYIEFVF
jgi:hypothetical protein